MKYLCAICQRPTWAAFLVCGDCKAEYQGDDGSWPGWANFAINDELQRRRKDAGYSEDSLSNGAVVAELNNKAYREWQKSKGGDT